MCVWVLSHFSCVRLFATLWIVTHQAPLSVGFSRQEYWSGLPCAPPGIFPTQESKAHLWHILHCRHTLFTIELLGHKHSLTKGNDLKEMWTWRFLSRRPSPWQSSKMSSNLQRCCSGAHIFLCLSHSKSRPSAPAAVRLLSDLRVSTVFLHICGQTASPCKFTQCPHLPTTAFWSPSPSTDN